jgi:hypothetical protein
MSKKRIQITSDITSNAEHFYERVEHPGVGNAKVIENDHPKTSSSTVTITTNPYTVETDGSRENTKTKEGASTTIDLEKKGYDTSQL